MRNNCLAIIPARGGSKRIPDKNRKLFLGKPIIEYSIHAAKDTNLFDDIMVSTDDKTIATMAKEMGASIPFLRSSVTSDDKSALSDVIGEVLSEYKKRNNEYTYFCCILPTAPFLTSQKIKKAFKILVENNTDSVVTVTKFSYPIQRALRMEKGYVNMIWPENYMIRSQDLEYSYHDCGQFYWMKTKSFLSQKKLFARKTKAFEIPNYESQDIDTLDDWKIAEMKFKKIQNI
jgi:pseudaminic acid cytidylyltransferase